ncbi:MAG: ABC transporter ATP-binding protein [Selenomonadaceae bacterium]|nr:ABC transporter ATP-binding protein [Selenomonadaceae bacterium]
MENEVVIKAEHLSKVYKIYEKDIDRLKETFHPFHKRYSRDFFALQDLNFEIKRGENVGLIGKNGAGKSTLLKIITGVITPTSGTIQVKGKIASLLELGAGFNPDMTGIENVYMNGLIMGYSREDMQGKVDDIVAFADIGDFINQPVKTYSSGMFARLAFAVNAFVQPDILIIDEALSVGDAFFQSKCMDKMRSMIEGGVTVLFVSHDTFAVKNLCERAFYLESGKLIMDAPAKYVVEAYNTSIIQKRRETTSDNLDRFSDLIDQVKLFQMNDDTKDFKIPIDEESLLRGKEIFLKNATYQRIQDGRADLINVQLMNLDGELISEVAFAQEVILRMVVKFNQYVRCIGMGYHIRNATGIDLIYSDSRFNKTKAIFDAKKDEVYVIDWKFKVELRSEMYTIACVISSPIDDKFLDADPHDYVPCAIQFKVVNPNAFLTLAGGYVHWHNDLKVQHVKNF